MPGRNITPESVAGLRRNIQTILITENGPAECLADVPRRLLVKE
jgi:hypothetical protein